MHEQISLAMKYAMRADIFTRRAYNPKDTHKHPKIVKLHRSLAAESWWGWRRATRKARLYHSFARILLEFDQEVEIGYSP